MRTPAIGWASESYRLTFNVLITVGSNWAVRCLFAAERLPSSDARLLRNDGLLSVISGNTVGTTTLSRNALARQSSRYTWEKILIPGWFAILPASGLELRSGVGPVEFLSEVVWSYIVRVVNMNCGFNVRKFFNRLICCYMKHTALTNFADWFRWLRWRRPQSETLVNEPGKKFRVTY